MSMDNGILLLKTRNRLEIEIERLDWNLIRIRGKIIALMFSEHCFDWSNSNPISISISSL